ncbi:hypothetical protein SLEP1_g21547 [Rubroshorea leprosula]|uniref:Uncharacterized protein n=1 Tax=Rubroshorea leprosula TaxID=152421 RepID=A0AAV5JCC5_9ROSI|nr:hypothetical protein SLEP1_g21547 [Rubroshorea leprosula]
MGSRPLSSLSSPSPSNLPIQTHFKNMFLQSNWPTRPMVYSFFLYHFIPLH